MDLQGISETKTNSNAKPPNKKVIYIVAALAVLVVAIGGFMAHQNVQETNRKLPPLWRTLRTSLKINQQFS